MRFYLGKLEPLMVVSQVLQVLKACHQDTRAKRVREGMQVGVMCVSDWQGKLPRC